MSNPFKQAAEMANKIRISSIFSSLLWILPYAIAALVIVSFTSNSLVQIFFIVIIAAILVVILLTFLCTLTFGNENDKNRLRTEEYAYNMKVLDVLGDPEHLIAYTQATLANKSITNPTLKNLTPAKELSPPENNTQLTQDEHE